MMKKTNIFLMVALLWAGMAFGQINIGGQPVAWSKNVDISHVNVPLYHLPKINWTQVAQEDSMASQRKQSSRFGYKHEVQIDTENSGVWHTLTDGSKLWQLEIKSAGAISLNMVFKHYWLPEGATLYIYGKNSRHVIGGYTSRNNKGKKEDGRGFATTLVYDDHIVMEYHAPVDATEKETLELSTVVHAYRNIQVPKKYRKKNYKSFNQSVYCQVNINCPEGNNWQDEKRGVARIIRVNNGCTGTLIQNEKKDGTFFFLTASHCVENDGYDVNGNVNLDDWIFVWEYESPATECAASVTEPDIISKSTHGATLLAQSKERKKPEEEQGTDFALLLLDESPFELPLSHPPYFNGWTLDPTPPKGGVLIHHPKGDVKKIATHDMVPIPFKYPGDKVEGRWQVTFMPTQSGVSHSEFMSSGSPLFTNDGYITGVLATGTVKPNCNSNAGPNDSWTNTFGRFDISWDYFQDDKERLKPWLDPDNKLHTSIPGSYMNPCKPLANPVPVVDLVNVASSQSFNFIWGVNTYIRSREIDVRGRLFVNKNARGGYSDNPKGTAPVHSHLNVNTFCEFERMTIFNNSDLVVGDNSAQNTAHMRINSGTLSLQNGSSLVIEENSTLTIDVDATLQLDDNVEIEVRSGGLLDINGAFDLLPGIGQNISITGGGTVRIGGNNELNLSEGSKIVLTDSKLIMERGSKFHYSKESTIKLNGINSTLELAGTTTIAPGATFTFTADDAGNMGRIVFSPSNPESAITPGAGSKFVLPPSRKNVSLEIKNSTYLDVDNIDFEYFDEFIADDTHIKISPGATFHVAAPKTTITNTAFTGGTFSIYRSDMNTTTGERSQRIDGCTFQDMEINAAPGFLYPVEPAEIVNCTLNNSKILANNPLNVKNCILNNSWIKLARSGFYEVSGCSFYGRKVPFLNTTAIHADRAGNGIQIKNNHIEGYNVGLAATASSALILECNTIINNDIGIISATSSRLTMNGAGAGKNTVADNTESNIQYYLGRKINLEGGGNSFANDTLADENNHEYHYIFEGVMEYQGCIDGIAYNALSNRWSNTSPDSKPQDMPEKFELAAFYEYQNPLGKRCRTCAVKVTDLRPLEEAPDCGLSGTGAQSNSQTCGTCPVIFTESFTAVPLVQAIHVSMETSTLAGGTNDKLALEMFRQILSYTYPLDNKEIYEQLIHAYTMAKMVAGKLTAHNEMGYVKPKMENIFTSFNPSRFVFHTTSDVFWYKIDQAEQLRYERKLAESITLLESIQNESEDFYSNYISPILEYAKILEGIENGEIPEEEVDDIVGGIIAKTPEEILNDKLKCIRGGGSGGGSDVKEILEKYLKSNTSGESPSDSPLERKKDRSEEDKNFNLYPNPATKNLTIQFNNSPSGKLLMMNIVGKTIFEIKATELKSTQTIDVSTIPAGVYIVRYQHLDGSANQQRIVVE